jgi:hypothetical protein
LWFPARTERDEAALMLTREYCLEQAEICEAYAAEAVRARLRNEWLVTARLWREAAGEPATSADVVAIGSSRSERDLTSGAEPDEAKERRRSL